MAKPKAPKKLNGQATVAPAETASAMAPEAPISASETASAEPMKSTRKPTIVRTEIRANIVPINVEEEIRRLAYLMSERRGFEPGHESEDWLAAEREVRERYHQQSA
jgi:hypothetical protein